MISKFHTMLLAGIEQVEFFDPRPAEMVRADLAETLAGRAD